MFFLALNKNFMLRNIRLIFLLGLALSPFFLSGQTLAPDEDGTPYTTCNADGANATRTSNDLASPVNVGTIDDRSCYANYKETSLYGTTWGIYNITDGSNNQDAENTLQPRIERALPVASNTNIGSYVKFTGTFRILEVGDTSGTTNDGTYIAQAKGQHTGGGGSADPAICLYLAKPVFDVNGNQIAFDIYAERILVRGGSGSTGREIVFLKRVNKNEATNFELEVGFRQDPNNSNSKIHYCDATIGGEVFSFNIPEPDRATQSKIRYGAYRVKGGRAQIRWANTSHIKSENGVDQKLGNQEPMITLLGEPTVTIDQGTSYTDSGAIAIDNYDGDLSEDIVISNPVNVNVPGIYTITYNVTDANGNAATQVTRTVTVSGASTSSTQTSLPGTIEVETGDLSQNNNHYDRNKIGSGNGGTNNIVDNWRKTRIQPTAADSESGAGVNGTIINAVTVTADGNYDFTFTYFKNSTDGIISINSTDAIGGNATQLASFTLLRNDALGTNTATTSSYSTQTVTGVALTTGITHITFTNADSKNVDLDNVIVTAAGAKPVITLLGDNPLIIEQGGAYSDPGATALGTDGSTDLTGSIVVGGDTVDVNTPGTYTVTYNVSDGGGAADEVTRTVNVIPDTVNATTTGDWNQTATWGGNPVPGSSDDVYIPDGVVVTVSDAQSANTIRVTNAANVIVDSGGALSVTGNVYLGRFDFGLEVRSETSSEAMGTLTVGGSVQTMNSDDVTTATDDKRIFVKRTLANDKWYLLSSMSSKQPRVNRMTNSDFITNATPAYSIAVYNNANAANSKYEYFSTTLTDSDEVALGAGMSVSVNGTGNTNTTGEFGYKAFYTHGSTVDIAIAVDGGTSDAFNLVGNPFLSNLYGNTNANATNVLSQNTGVLEEATLWFWNADTEAFVTKNQSSAAFTIPPVTGFFVKSSVAGGNFTFTKTMETHTATGNISSKSTRFEIDLSIASGKNTTSTSIKYIDGTSISFDNGYDSSTFGGYASSFEVYTNLLGGDVSKKLAIQSLPNSDYENMVVPVGVTAEENSEITFTASVSNLPEGYEVYLEDRLQGTFTRLDELNSEYKVTISSKSTDGRFFLHTKSAGALSTDNTALDGVGMYTVNENTLRVTGINSTNASVTVFNIIGKQVLSTSFSSKGVSDIALPNLNTGVYIVQLSTEKGKLNKKIVLE